MSAWGPELLCEEAYCSADPYNETNPNVLVNHINGWIFWAGVLVVVKGAASAAPFSVRGDG